MNLQALGYRDLSERCNAQCDRDFSEEGNAQCDRDLSEESNAQWIVVSQSRGLGTNTFQTPLLSSKIGELELLEKSNADPTILMRTKTNSEDDVRIGVFEFSP